MPSWRDVRRIALALPGAQEKQNGAAKASWTTGGKAFAWERPLRRSDLEYLGDTAPAGAILGVRTPDLEMKEALLANRSGAFFTTPHFDGYCAVLIILAKVSTSTLREVLVESWLACAPKRVAQTYLATKNSVSARKRTR